MKKTVFFLISISFMWVAVQSAYSQTPLERRAGDVCQQFRQAPGDFEKLFTPAFLNQVPQAQLTAFFAQYFSQLGRCTANKITNRQSDNAGDLEFTFEKGYAVPAKLSVAADSPNLIDSLWLGNPTKTSSSLTEIVSDLKGLPGETALFVARLDNQSITPIIAHNVDRELAIGSAFKLYVLAE